MLIERSGGSHGVRNVDIIDSAVAQPQMTFDGVDLHVDIVAKAAALCFSLVQGHGFIDGNKRVGHAAMTVFLRLNGTEVSASIDALETLILEVASGRRTREQLESWLRRHLNDAGNDTA